MDFDDELLDRALNRYAVALPRPGLEARILNRARSRPARFPFGLSILSAAAAAAVVCSVFLFPRHETLALLPPAPPRAMVAFPEVPPGPRHHRRRAELPKLAQFPSPVPLTDEERALATVQPLPAPAAVLTVAPIQISAIQIEPLPTGGQ